MNADRAGSLRYIQLRKPAEHLPDHIVCGRLLCVVETRQVYIFVDLLPADRIPELVYFPRLPLLVGSLFEYGEILQRATIGFAVVGGDADAATLEPNFCYFLHNRILFMPCGLFLLSEILVPFGDDLRLV